MNITKKNTHSRPKSSAPIHNLPELSNRIPKSLLLKKTSRDNNKNNENEFDFKVNLIPKIDNEKIYKNNIDLKQDIKDLNKKIDFLKSNNHKLSQIITQKNKEINELTNQIILKNKELLTREKKEKKIKKNEKENEKKSPICGGLKKQNTFEKDLQLKKYNNEISRIKEEYNKLTIELRNKEEEILDLKRNKKVTDYNELVIKNEILTQEFNKLKEMYLLSLDMNKKNENFGKNENILKAEIQTQHEIIIQLKQEIDSFSLERKRMMTEIKELKNKLELSINNNKFINNTKNKYENKYRKNIKAQVIQKEYEEEKQQMITKINKLQKSLDYYRLIAMKSKDFGAYTNTNKGNKEGNKTNNFNNNNIINNDKKIGIISKNINNPEENYDSKTLLMQSIITELTNEKKELLEKIKTYENQIQNNNNKTIKQLENNISSNNNTNKLDNLLKTNEEIIIADNNQNNNMITEIPNNNNISIKNEEIKENEENENKSKIDNTNINISNKEDDLKIEKKENENNENENEKEDIMKEDIKFDDIFELNLEFKNINSSNVKNIFNNIFIQFQNENKNMESNKELILNSLVNEISLKLNCNTNDEDKKEIYEKIKLYLELDENYEDNFYNIFDNIINHNEQSIKIIDNENELILKKLFQEKKDVINTIIENNNNILKINNFYDILFENNLKIKKNAFMHLCYKLKTENCNSLHDIEIKGLSKYIE